MQLKDLYDYKNQLMFDLISHESIVHLINEDVQMKNADSLLYTQIFPYEYLPETVQSGSTYVCCDVDIQSVDNKTFLIPTLYIWVFAHRSRLIIPNHGGVRVDNLCSEICMTINGSRYYGLGELDLYSVKRFAPQTDYNGKLMTFRTREFNRPHDGKKPIPSNRKTG